MVKHFQDNEIDKCFEQDIQLIFTTYTKISHINDTSNRLPMHVWKFTDFGTIPPVNFKQEHFIGKFLFSMYIVYLH